MSNVESLRSEIDQLHEELHAILERRRALTEAIWDIKTSEGMPLYCPEREDALIKKFSEMGEGQSSPQVKELNAAIMSALLKEYRRYLESKYSHPKA